MDNHICISPKAVGAGVVALIAMALALAGPAGAAVTTYPAGGSSFEGDAQGWTGSETSCSLLSGVNVLCSAETTYDSAGGDPGGALATEVAVTVNLLGIFSGSGVWTSPSFTVPAGSAVTEASFHLDRAFAAGGLLDLGPASELRATLVDETAGTFENLLTETVPSDSTYGSVSVDVPAGTVVAGHAYRVQLATTITSSLASLGVLGRSSTRYDNVGLTVATESPASGPPAEREAPHPPAGGGSPQQPPGGGSGRSPVSSLPSGGRQGDTARSPGVGVTRGPLSDTAIEAIERRLAIEAAVGHGPGGSFVPLSDCTIVGTPKSDRIVGTAGNDVICGLGGNDRIGGGGGRDVIDGGAGADRLFGQGGADFLLGLRGADLLRGGSGPDRLAAGRGRDRVLAGAGRDLIGARDGRRDLVDGGPGRDRAIVDPVRLDRAARRSAPSDRLVGIEAAR